MKVLLVLLTIVAVTTTGAAAYALLFFWSIEFRTWEPFAIYGLPAISLDIACIMLWAKTLKPSRP